MASLIDALTMGLDSAVGATANIGAKLGGEPEPEGPKLSGSLTDLLNESRQRPSPETLNDSYTAAVLGGAYASQLIRLTEDEMSVELTDHGVDLLSQMDLPHTAPA